jgi:putative methyltransferase (TIGR04325 family)
MHRLRRLARLMLPPAIPMAIDRLRHAVVPSSQGGFRLDLRPDWERVPEGWRRSRAAGWSHPSIADTQRRRWADLAPLVRGTEPLDAHFFGGRPGSQDESAHNVHLTFAYVLARATRGQARTSVLDWGGGIGYHALLAERLLPESPVEYVVKELPEIAALGRELMPTVRFETDSAACLRRTYDLVFASSSIQYEEDWRGLVSSLAGATHGWLFLARVPCVRAAQSFVVVQRPRRWGYRTEYLSWVLNRDALLAQAESLGFRLDREFLAGGRSHLSKAPEEVDTLSFLFHLDRPDLLPAATEHGAAAGTTAGPSDGAMTPADRLPEASDGRTAADVHARNGGGASNGPPPVRRAPDWRTA